MLTLCTVYNLEPSCCSGGLPVANRIYYKHPNIADGLLPKFNPLHCCKLLSWATVANCRPTMVQSQLLSAETISFGAFRVA